MNQIQLGPISHVAGEIFLPGSKSLSNRILLLSALAEGTTTITNLLDSDDVRYMLAALQQLGVVIKLSPERTQCQVQGLAAPFAAQEQHLYLGNAGTAMRPLCAALCLGQGTFTLTGEPRMKERPIAHLVEALQHLGADIEYLQQTGYPPLRIRARGLPGGHVAIRGNLSSQFLTALLMAAPLARQAVTITIDGPLVSKPYIALTLHVMATFGVQVENQQFQTFIVPGGQQYRSPGQVLVEGDASSATYFLSAAAIRGGTVRVYGLGPKSIQGDFGYAAVLQQMGATVQYGPDWVQVSRGHLHGIDIDMNAMPDAAMTLATTALFAQGPTTIRNIYNWRVKETDRLAAMSTELRKLGAQVIEGRDFLTLIPPAHIRPATIDTYNDHRMAMSFALAALGDATITINDPDCTAKTFPQFFQHFQSLT
jgi:3-phosphoshikimate 1-carboxyvinyltransferase